MQILAPILADKAVIRWRQITILALRSTAKGAEARTLRCESRNGTRVERDIQHDFKGLATALGMVVRYPTGVTIGAATRLRGNDRPERRLYRSQPGCAGLHRRLQLNQVTTVKMAVTLLVLSLVILVNCLRQGLRDGDMLGRYGGEEFMLLLPGTSRVAAMTVAERVASFVRDQPLVLPDKSLGMTVSQGLATQDEAATLSAIIALADRRLYAAKGAGRDRVMSWEAFDTLPPMPTRCVVEGAEACPFESPRRHDDSVVKA